MGVCRTSSIRDAHGLPVTAQAQSGAATAPRGASSAAPRVASALQPDQSSNNTSFFQKLKMKGFRAGNAGGGYEAAPHTPRNV